MSQSPTDPVKELIEAAEKATPGPCIGSGEHLMTGIHSDAAEGLIADFCPDYFDEWANIKFTCAARNAIPSLSAMVAREEAVREYIKELRATTVDYGNGEIGPSQAHCECADRLETIFQKEGA